QVLGRAFERGKAIHKLVGGDVVQADARAVESRTGLLGIFERDAVVIDGPGEKPAVGADRQVALPRGLEPAEVLAARAVPDVGVNILPARDDALSVTRYQDLANDAIAGLGRQRLARGRVPPIDGAVHGADQRLAVIGELKVAGAAVDAETFFA